ncbi:TnsA endonuclease N-terminal domain-containing protein [Oceanobacillus picturae]|uniref:TnsA endonuclease N-terminal domain-containing protein n=1 Tax=Oceanobacillus picturae TaxID=171693 RepID=UPI00362E4309
MKYSRKWTEKSITRRIKAGNGQGYKENYIPWLKVQDVPSSGVVKRVKGMKIQRVFHFMSLLEYQYFCLLEWSEKVNDIREQFPLFHREDAQYIAEKKGIVYPLYPNSDVPIVMTSDFAIQFMSVDGSLKEVIRTIKPSSELNKRRVLEKLEIEREYWYLREIDWGIVTERDICPTKIYNISFFRGAHNFNEHNLVDELLPDFFEALFNYQNENLITILDHLDSCLKIEKGTFLSLFKFLLSRREIEIDMTRKIDLKVIRCKDITVLKGANSLDDIYQDGVRSTGS